RRLRGLGSCPLRSSGHGLPAPDDPRSGSGAVGGLGPHSSEGVHTAGGPVQPRRGSTPPAAHREPLESLVFEEPGPDERRHTGAGRGQSACPQDHAPDHGPAPKPTFGRIGMRIDVRGVKIQQARTSRAFSLWLRLMTTQRGQRIEVPLLPNSYALRRQGAFRNTIQVTEREDGTLVFGLAQDVSNSYQRQREAYQPATEQLALDFGLRTLFATDRGDLLGRDFMAYLAKLDRRITARAAHLQRMGRRPTSSK